MARAIVNCRILPGESPASVKDKLVEVLADPKITVTFVGEANPSKPSPLRPDVMDAVESLTKQMFPGVIVVPVMSTGATDGLYLRNGEIPTYGVDGTFGDIDDVRAHGRDERVGVKQFYEGLEFQYRLIKALASAGRARSDPYAWPGYSLRAQAAAPRGEPPRPSRIARDPDVVASFLEDAAHFPGGHAAGLVVAGAAKARSPPSLRSAASVLPIGAQSSLTGGATPMGELLLEHVASEPHPRDRGRRGPRRGRRHAASISTPRWPRRPLLPAVADLHRRLRRRHRRDQRRRRRDVQVRHDARLGARRSPSSCRAATCSTSSAARPPPTATATSRSSCRTGPSRLRVPRYRMPRGAEALGRLFRRARHGSDRSVHRLRRHARRHHRGDASGAAAPAGDVPRVRAVRRSRPRRSRSSRGCATRRAETWRTGDPRGLDVSAIEHMDARCLAVLREDGADRANGVRFRRTPRSRCW